MRSRRTFNPRTISPMIFTLALTVSALSNSGSLSSCEIAVIGERQPFHDGRTAPADRRTPARSSPRISSGTSGLFFCGIIELPVQIASGNSTKANSWLDHNINSSAEPAQMATESSKRRETLAEDHDRSQRRCYSLKSAKTQELRDVNYSIGKVVRQWRRSRAVER